MYNPRELLRHQMVGLSGGVVTSSSDVSLFANNARAAAASGDITRAKQLLAQAEFALANMQPEQEKSVMRDFVSRVRDIVNGNPQLQAQTQAKLQEVSNLQAQAGITPALSSALPAPTTAFVPAPQSFSVMDSLSNMFSSGAATITNNSNSSSSTVTNSDPGPPPNIFARNVQNSDPGPPPNIFARPASQAVPSTESASVQQSAPQAAPAASILSSLMPAAGGAPAAAGGLLDSLDFGSMFNGVTDSIGSAMGLVNSMKQSNAAIKGVKNELRQALFSGQHEKDLVNLTLANKAKTLAVARSQAQSTYYVKLGATVLGVGLVGLIALKVLGD